MLNLKPSCVVCDVVRPADAQEEEARWRPDVLVIEAGEILLLGEPNLGFDIGLPPGVAYACLAEAAMLAMEGRYENSTLGGNIEMDKVKETYGLIKKPGLQLEGAAMEQPLKRVRPAIAASVGAVAVATAWLLLRQKRDKG